MGIIKLQRVFMKNFLYCIIFLLLISCSEIAIKESPQLIEKNDENPMVDRFLMFLPDFRFTRNYLNNSTCSVHFNKMQIQSVKIFYGLPTFAWSSYTQDIMINLFPYCNDVIWGGCFIGNYGVNAEIYICEYCNIDRDKWMVENWEDWEKSKPRPFNL